MSANVPEFNVAGRTHFNPFMGYSVSTFGAAKISGDHSPNNNGSDSANDSNVSTHRNSKHNSSALNNNSESVLDSAYKVRRLVHKKPITP